MTSQQVHALLTALGLAEEEDVEALLEDSDLHRRLEAALARSPNALSPNPNHH